MACAHACSEHIHVVLLVRGQGECVAVRLVSEQLPYDAAIRVVDLQYGELIVEQTVAVVQIRAVHRQLQRPTVNQHRLARHTIHRRICRHRAVRPEPAHHRTRLVAVVTGEAHSLADRMDGHLADLATQLGRAAAVHVADGLEGGVG